MFGCLRLFGFGCVLIVVVFRVVFAWWLVACLGW